MKNGTNERPTISRVLFKLRMTIVLILLMMLLAACVYNAGRDMLDRTTVENFNLKNFMGRWYEIARFDHRFERGMTDVTADYTLQSDGMVEVVNEGMRGGKLHRSVGRAKTTSHPGQLKVSFFWIFYSDYNILEVGEGGQWALVGSRSPQYLWILSRTPTLPEATVDYIVSQASKRGYDVDKLIFLR